VHVARAANLPLTEERVRRPPLSHVPPFDTCVCWFSYHIQPHKRKCATDVQSSKGTKSSARFIWTVCVRITMIAFAHVSAHHSSMCVCMCVCVYPRRDRVCIHWPMVHLGLKQVFYSCTACAHASMRVFLCTSAFRSNGVHMSNLYALTYSLPERHHRCMDPGAAYLKMRTQTHEKQTVEFGVAQHVH
jgi:hypothetical protein